jgi:hypothetical protein
MSRFSRFDRATSALAGIALPELCPDERVVFKTIAVVPRAGGWLLPKGLLCVTNRRLTFRPYRNPLMTGGINAGAVSVDLADIRSVTLRRKRETLLETMSATPRVEIELTDGSRLRFGLFQRKKFCEAITNGQGRDE